MRCALFLLDTHRTQIISQRSLSAELATLRRHARRQLLRARDAVGVSMAALRFLQRSIRTEESDRFFGPEAEAAAAAARKRKRDVLE